MGKGWARGLTKETDPRVARAAAGHRGLRYRASGRPRNDSSDRRIKWPRIQIPQTDSDWTSQLAYAVGLLASDGCLGGGKTVHFTSKDRDLIETFQACIGARGPIGLNGGAYRVQVSDIRFYRWLDSIGVTPRKSLTLGGLEVPQRFMLDTVRGLLDGDGSIYTGMTVPNRARYPGHVYQRLRVIFHSASALHVEWVRLQIKEILGLSGWITAEKKPGCSLLYVLRYSKHESIALLSKLYEDPSAPRLERKWLRWVEFRDHGKPTKTWTNRRLNLCERSVHYGQRDRSATIQVRRSSRIGTGGRLKSVWAKVH